MSSAPNLLRRALVVLASGVLLSAQTPLNKAALAKDPDLFITTAINTLHWETPAEPFHVMGPIYFVGTKGLSAWLFKTTEGHILLNTGMDNSGPMVEAAIRKLDLKPEDIKILLACHAHIDHVGGHAYIQERFHAKVAMMDTEVDLMESGGKRDFHYAQYEKFMFPPVKVDRIIHDGDTISLGEVALTAHRTPGHTQGGNTYTTTVTEGGKQYFVVFPDGTSINPGYRITKNPSYPGIYADYLRTFQILADLKPDIWLAPHTEFFGFEAKRARAAREGARAWVDPEGYQRWIASQRKAFDVAVAAEAGHPTPAARPLLQ